MSILLTVVVPVYKVEKYINKCLDSLLLPEGLMEKIEVLIINDGTTDKSAAIAKEYEKRYPLTFRVIDKENGGHGSAWNRGVKEANGKYLRFLDSDDWLSHFETFVRDLERCDTDLVFTNLHIYRQDKDNHITYSNYIMQPGKEYSIDDFDWEKTKSLYNGHNITNFHMCTYKTAILKQYHPVFLEKVFYDDEILFVLPLCTAKTFCFYDVVLYNYLLGRQGQTVDNSVRIRNISSLISVRKQTISFVNEHCPSANSVKRKLDSILNSRCDTLMDDFLNLSYNEFKRKMDDFSQFVKNSFNNYIPNNLYKRYFRYGPIITWLLYKYISPVYIRFK